MLVLTRRVGEEIVVNGNIRITVSAIRGERVRIGISAPDYVRIDRDEIHERRGWFAEERSIAQDMLVGPACFT